MSHKSKNEIIETSSHLPDNDLYRVLFEQATDGIFIADEQGYYIEVNQHGCKMLGYTRDQILNLAINDLIPNEDLEHDPIQLCKLQAGKSLLKECRLRCKDGGLITVEISAQMLSDGNCLGIVRDVSKRKQAEEELQRREHEFRTLIEHFPDTIARFDREARYLYVNQSPEKVSGIPVQELIGQRIGERLAERLHSTVPEDVLFLREAIKQVFVTGESFETEVKLTLSTGEYIRNVRLIPEFSQAEQVTSVLYISRDMTEQKHAEETLRVSNQRLQLALDAGQMGEWEWDIITGDVVWSEKCRALYGLPPDTPMSYERFLQVLHPNDRERIDGVLRKAVENRSSYDELIRTIWPDGSIHWTASRGQVHCNATGKAIRMVGVTFDITRWKEAEEVQQKDQQELEVFFSQTIDGCYFMMLDEPVRWDDTVDQEEILNYAFAHQHITRVNDAMLAQYDATREQMLQLAPNDFFKHNLSHGRQLWRQLFNAGTIRLESDERKLDGTPMWIEGEYIILYDGEGRITGHFGIQRDITERKQLEEALRRANQKYVTLMNSVDGIVWEADARTFQFSFVSQQAEGMLGYPVEQWIGEPTFWKDHIHPDDREWVIDFCVKSIEEKRSYDFEYRMLTTDEEVVWLHDVVAIVVENDQPVQLRGIMVDITERKQMEAERRESEARFRAFVDHATDAIFFHEWGTILDVNSQACASLGYSREELIGMTPYDFDVNLNQAFMDQIEARLNAGEVLTFETQHRRKNGTIFPVEVRVRGFVQGESHFVVSVARDITERKQTEARMRALIDAIPDMLVRHDREGRYLEIKAAPSIPLNYAIPDAIGKTVSEMLPHDSRLAEHIVHRIEKALDTNEMDVQEYELTFDGKALYREARTTPINEHEVLMLIRDITERKEAEARLQRYNQRLSILHRIDRGILNAQSPQEIAETVLEQLAQLIPCEFLSVILYNDDLTEERIFALRHAAELGQYSQEIQPVVQNEVLETLKAGKTAVAPDLLEQAGSHARLALELESRGVRSALASPMIVHGKLIGTIALAALEVGFFTSEYQQITEEVAAQIAIALHQAKLNDQIRQYNTELEQRVRERTMQLENANRELEMFSYSVSHDLRAPLRAIQGFAEIIARRHRDNLNEEGRRYFDHIVTAAKQMDQLISDLLNYARLGRQQLHLEAIPLKRILDTVLDNLQPLIANVSAQIRLQDDLPVIQGDRTLLIQIFTNLLHNALTYHRPDFAPIIDVSWHLDDGHTTICIRDNGIGIPSEFHEKVFDIFQRLHGQEQYPGTGIGLAIVRRSVDLLNGRVWLETVTEGSLFCVSFPHQVEERKTT